jgi:hypothetical protein
MLPNNRFGQKAKSSERANVVRFAPESGLPDLRTTTFPFANYSERRHRGLARRRVAVRRSAILVVAEGQRPKRGTPSRARRRYLAGLTGKMTAFGIAPETVVALAIAARPEAVCNE